MKSTITTIFILTLSVMLYSQNDSTLTYTYNKENVVASAIDGTWHSEQLNTSVIFEKDVEILKLLPNKYYPFFKDKVIYHAGYVTFESPDKRCLFILIEHNGNSHLVYFRPRNNEPYGDAESFNLFIAKGKTSKEDRLFIGGDFNNQSFHEFSRVQ